MLINYSGRTYCNVCPHWPNGLLPRLFLGTVLKISFLWTLELLLLLLSLFWGHGKDSDSWPGFWIHRKCIICITSFLFSVVHSGKFPKAFKQLSSLDWISQGDMTRKQKVTLCVCESERAREWERDSEWVREREREAHRWVLVWKPTLGYWCRICPSSSTPRFLQHTEHPPLVISFALLTWPLTYLNLCYTAVLYLSLLGGYLLWVLEWILSTPKSFPCKEIKKNLPLVNWTITDSRKLSKLQKNKEVHI